VTPPHAPRTSLASALLRPRLALEWLADRDGSDLFADEQPGTVVPTGSD